MAGDSRQVADDILKALSSKKYHSVYFLQGEEPYFIDLISDYIEDNVLTESEKSFNLTVFYGKDTDLITILSQARRFPMLAEKQVVIVKEAQQLSGLRKAESAKLLENYLENPAPTTLLVFAHKYKTLDGRSRLSKLLTGAGVFFTSKKLYENRIPQWITDHVRQKGRSISPKAAIMLTEHVGADPSRLAAEIGKLLINVDDGEEISEKAVVENIGISKEYNVFELQKALISGNKEQAWTIINYFGMNPKSNPPIAVIGFLFRFFSKLLLFHGTKDRSEQGLAKLLGVHPFFVKDFFAAAKKYPVGTVINAVHGLREADLKSKGIASGSITDREILKELALKII